MLAIKERLTHGRLGANPTRWLLGRAATAKRGWQCNCWFRLGFNPLLCFSTQVVRKETERLKNEINNAAAEIAQNSSAQATVILAKAKAEALLKVEKARDTGLSYIYQQLNITKEAQKSAFNYLRTLRGQQNVKLNVGYQTLMARD